MAELPYPDESLSARIAGLAQLRVIERGEYPAGRIASFAGDAIVDRTAQLGFEVYEELSILPDDASIEAIVAHVNEDVEMATGDEKAFARLLAFQARAIVLDRGEYDRRYAGAQSILAAASEAGRLTLQSIDLVNGMENRPPQADFIGALGSIVQKAEARTAPEVQSSFDMYRFVGGEA